MESVNTCSSLLSSLSYGTDDKSDAILIDFHHSQQQTGELYPCSGVFLRIKMIHLPHSDLNSHQGVIIFTYYSVKVPSVSLSTFLAEFIIGFHPGF